jgi:GABA(A) receptor-associated protein
MGFKNDYSFEDRCDESKRILIKFSQRIPIICEKNKKSKLLDIDKKKYLIPIDFTVGQFMYVIRKRLLLPPDKAIFIFINGIIPSCSSTIINIYDMHKDSDGFLYVTYDDENVFG